MSNLILTICSNHKREKGQIKQYDADARKAADVLLPDMREKLYRARKRAFKHITDSTRDGKFPAGRPRNKALQCGPDITPNGEENNGHYMPALKRYDGRFYKNFKDSVDNVDQCIRRLSKDSGDDLLIVSGLYGLLSPSEPIQKYSCDVTDEPKINRVWREGNLLTELVISYIHEAGITRVFDLMADENYRHLIDWKLMEQETYSTVFYARCHNQTGTDMLPEFGHAAGLFLSEQPKTNLSDIDDSHRLVFGITFASEEPEWVPGVAFSKREKCILWAVPMMNNIEKFLDREGVRKEKPYSVKNRIGDFRDARNKNSLVADDMDIVNNFRNKLVHENHVPGKSEIQKVRDRYGKVVKWATQKGYRESEDVDYQ